MQEKTKEFIRKIRFDTYIYTITFIVVSILYFLFFSDDGTSPVMLLLAAFAFYTVGRQVNFLKDLEAGVEINTKPRAPAWVRGITYFVILLMILKFFIK